MVFLAQSHRDEFDCCLRDGAWLRCLCQQSFAHSLGAGLRYLVWGALSHAGTRRLDFIGRVVGALVDVPEGGVYSDLGLGLNVFQSYSGYVNSLVVNAYRLFHQGGIAFLFDCCIFLFRYARFVYYHVSKNAKPLRLTLYL